MKARQIIFLACVIWFFAWIPVGYFWGINPIRWAADYSHEQTLERAREDFPFHLAPLPTSPISHHAAQIENEDTDPPPEFDPVDWSLREMRYRWGACFFLFLISTVVMRWFLSLIVQGKQGWLD